VEPEEDVIEEARQKLVEIVQKMMQYMDRRSREEGQLFRGLMQRAVPGMPPMIDQGGTIPEITARINDFQRPGWEGRTTQAFSRMATQHPVFADPAVSQANTEYLGLRPRMLARSAQLTTEMESLGAPGAAAVYRNLTQQAARTTPAQPIRPQGPGSSPTPASSAQPTRPQPDRPQPARPTQAQPTQPRLAQPTQPQPAEPQSAQSQPGRSEVGQAQVGTERTVTAQASGPVHLDARIVEGAGKVTVRADPSCTRATLTIRTADRTGPSAEAVQRAGLDAGIDGRLTARTDGASGTVITRSGNGFSQTIRSSGNGTVMVAGNIDHLDIDNGRIRIGNITGGNFTISNGQGSSPVEVTAVVPEGSSVVARTTSADIETHGNLRSVEARSVSGDVTVGSADREDGTGTSGSAEWVDAHSVSGQVSVHSDRPSEVRAGSVSGDLRVTASTPEVAAQMRVDADSVSGRSDVPPESRRLGSQAGAQPQHASDGARDNHTARQTQTQTRQSGTALGS
jgi:hypothetical protein